jgi:hypothetical protein
MTERMSHEEYVTMQRRRVAKLARDILAGDVDVLDGSSKIVSLRDELDIDRDDEDLMAFVVVDSEADALPVGAEARNWSQDALDRKKPELQRARTWAFDVVLNRAKILLLASGPYNKSLDASGGSVFRNLIRPAMLE